MRDKATFWRLNNIIDLLNWENIQSSNFKELKKWSTRYWIENRISLSLTESFKKKKTLSRKGVVRPTTSYSWRNHELPACSLRKKEFEFNSRYSQKLLYVQK